MNEVSAAIARWLEQKRRTERAWAAVLSILALGSGTAVFLLMALLLYTLLSLVAGVLALPWPGMAALLLSAGAFVHSMRGRQDERELGFDPMGFWMLKDIYSVGPRLVLEGLRQVRACGQLGELNVAGCAQALGYLAAQNAAVPCEDLAGHCAQLPWPLLREQLSLLDGVLFLGEDAARVTLMEPFRLRLRWMLEREQGAGKEHEPAPPRPEATPHAVPVDQPEKLSAYEILGLAPSASMAEIKSAYRKRVKECHPDLFAGMDQSAQVLAERWTRALNAAYATLNPRHVDPSK